MREWLYQTAVANKLKERELASSTSLSNLTWSV